MTRAPSTGGQPRSSSGGRDRRRDTLGNFPLAAKAATMMIPIVDHRGSDPVGPVSSPA